MPDSNDSPPPPPASPAPPGRPIDAWFDGDQPPWDNSTGTPKTQGGASPVPAAVPDPVPVSGEGLDAPTVVPVVARARPAPVDLPRLPPVPLVPDDLPEARPVTTRSAPRPVAEPRRPLGTTGPATAGPEPERPRAQVFLACSVLMAIIAAMMIAVAVLLVALFAGFKKVQTRAKQNVPVVQPQNPPGFKGNPKAKGVVPAPAAKDVDPDD